MSRNMVLGIVLTVLTVWLRNIQVSAFNVTSDVSNLSPYTERCGSNETTEWEMGQFSSCSSACSCKPRCRLARDCCPDVDESVVSAKTSEDDVNTKCLPLKHMLSRSSSSDRLVIFSAHYLTVDSCPEGYLNTIHLNGCHNRFPSKVIDNVPVASWRTSTVYKNYHCAVCNNVLDPLPWLIYSTCLDLYLLNSVPETIANLNRITGSCETFLIPPTGVKLDLQRCNTDSYEGIVSSCNQTGHWEFYDKYVWDKCNSDIHISLFEADTEAAESVIYKNVFCFLCNHNGSALSDVTCRKLQNFKNISNSQSEKSTASFSTILNTESLMYSEVQHFENLSVPVADSSRAAVADSSGADTLPYCSIGEYYDLYKVR